MGRKSECAGRAAQPHGGMPGWPALPHLQSPHVVLPVPPHTGQGRSGMVVLNSGRPRCVGTRHCPTAASRSASGNSGCWMEGGCCCCCWTWWEGPAPLLPGPPASNSARAACGRERAAQRAAGRAVWGAIQACMMSQLTCICAGAALESPVESGGAPPPPHTDAGWWQPIDPCRSPANRRDRHGATNAVQAAGRPARHPTASCRLGGGPHWPCTLPMRPL